MWLHEMGHKELIDTLKNLNKMGKLGRNIVRLYAHSMPPELIEKFIEKREFNRRSLQIGVSVASEKAPVLILSVKGQQLGFGFFKKNDNFYELIHLHSVREQIKPLLRQAVQNKSWELVEQGAIVKHRSDKRDPQEIIDELLIFAMRRMEELEERYPGFEGRIEFEKHELGPGESIPLGRGKGRGPKRKKPR